MRIPRFAALLLSGIIAASATGMSGGSYANTKESHEHSKEYHGEKHSKKHEKNHRHHKGHRKGA